MIELLLIAAPVGVRQALRARLSLESDLTIVGEAVDSPQGISLTQSLRPNAVLIDAETPNLDAQALVQAITSLEDSPGIVVLSLHMAAVQHALRHTPAHVVGKHQGLVALVNSIRSVAAPDRD